jgi:hypothetical protein
MAVKAHVFVGYFRVTSYCRKGGSNVKVIPAGSTDVEHVIEFENGSTLPFDVQAESIHSGSPGRIEFIYGGGSAATKWAAIISQIGDGDTEKDTAKIKCTANAKLSAGIQTPKIEYRDDSTVPWQSDSSYTSSRILEIKFPIV